MNFYIWVDIPFCHCVWPSQCSLFVLKLSQKLIICLQKKIRSSNLNQEYFVKCQAGKCFWWPTQLFWLPSQPSSQILLGKPQTQSRFSPNNISQWRWHDTDLCLISIIPSAVSEVPWQVPRAQHGPAVRSSSLVVCRHGALAQRTSKPSAPLCQLCARQCRQAKGGTYQRPTDAKSGIHDLDSNVGSLHFKYSYNFRLPVKQLDHVNWAYEHWKMFFFLLFVSLCTVYLPVHLLKIASTLNKAYPDRKGIDFIFLSCCISVTSSAVKDEHSNSVETVL